MLSQSSDYTASFMRKAKWKPFEIMKSSENFISALSQLGSSEVVDKDVATTIEGYVCEMYGLRNFSDVNEARLYLFRKIYAPKKDSNSLHKIKSSDPCVFIHDSKFYIKICLELVTNLFFVKMLERLIQ